MHGKDISLLAKMKDVSTDGEHVEPEKVEAKFGIQYHKEPGQDPTMTIRESNLDEVVGAGATARFQELIDELMADGKWEDTTPPDVITDAMTQTYLEYALFNREIDGLL